MRAAGKTEISTYGSSLQLDYSREYYVFFKGGGIQDEEKF